MAILKRKPKTETVAPTPPVKRAAAVTRIAPTPPPAPLEAETVARLTTFAPTRIEDGVSEWL